MIQKTLLSLIVPTCALPALALNVWPRVENMLVSGFSSQELGIVLLVSISALGMTAVPFAMAKAPNAGFWWFCLTFGVALGTLNYMMAVGAIGKAHDNVTFGILDRQTKASHVRDQIRDRQKERESLGSFKPTTQDMLGTADRAVELALEARDQECGKVGDFCRARQAQLATRQQDRADLASSYALTERAANLDKQIENGQRALAELGYIPAIADPQAARISRVVSIFITLGPDSLQTVADGIISFLAIFAEALALGMPRIILTALERPVQAPALPPLQIALRPVAPKRLAYKPPAPSPPPQTPSPAKQPPQPPGDLDQWIQSNLIRSSNRLKHWDAYTLYKKSTSSPMEFDQFHLAMSKHYQTQVENRRQYYLNVATRT